MRFFSISVLIVLPLILTGCSHHRKPIFVISRVYILEKQNNKQYKVIKSSNSNRTLEEEINLAPENLIGLTQSKLKELKDKILELVEENERLKNQ